jgi:hypothetical protein
MLDENLVVWSSVSSATSNPSLTFIGPASPRCDRFLPLNDKRLSRRLIHIRLTHESGRFAKSLKFSVTHLPKALAKLSLRKTIIFERN